MTKVPLAIEKYYIGNNIHFRQAPVLSLILLKYRLLYTEAWKTLVGYTGMEKTAEMFDAAGGYQVSACTT